MRRFLLVLLATLAFASVASSRVMPIVPNASPVTHANWWIGQGGRDGEAAVSGTVNWWLGQNGQPAPVQANWWLGTQSNVDEAPRSEPVPANQTLTWWLGSDAQAEDNAPPVESGPSSQGLDYATWEQFKQTVEDALSSNSASNVRLDQLRAELVEWREKFLTAQSANRTRIDTIRNQISALGEAPAEGETEPEEIANRREALNEQLTTLQAPGIAAEEAYLGADGLIKEIDATLRERQANELLELAPSPLVPLNWPPALSALLGVGNDIASETTQALDSPTSRQNAKDNLPATLLLLVLGLALLVKGRSWSEFLAGKFMSGTGRRAKRVVLALLVSLGQVVLPFLGIVFLISGVVTTGLLGPTGDAFLAALPSATFAFLAARWLGAQVFSSNDEAALLTGLSAERRAEGRFYAQILGILSGAWFIVGQMVPYEDGTKAAAVVLAFPLLLVAGMILFRYGQLLIKAAGAASEAGTTTPAQMLGLIGRAAMVLGIAGPVLAAIGYYTLAGFFTFPAIMSLALLALLIILQRLSSDIYALISRRPDEEDEESLIPVLIAFALAILSLPLFALIWGARWADLTEMWNKVREGFQLGETRIAPADFLTFAVVFAIGYVATRLLQGAMRSSVLPKTRIDPGGQTAIVSGLGYIGIFLAAIIAITTAGIDLSSLAIVAGALSVGIGFGMQNIVSNFISGIILLVERPISEGDWIEVNGQMGYVRDIAVRSTRIETFDKTDVIVPNSDLISGVVTNFTRGNMSGRIIVKVGVAYGTDTRRVEEILREIAEAHPLVTLNPKPGIIFAGFGADSLDFEIRAILRDVNFSVVAKSDMHHEIAKRFTEEGIEIPFAQRDIWLRNPEALTGKAKAPEPNAPPPDSRDDTPPAQTQPEIDVGDSDADGER